MRKCPFTGCEQVIPESKFACRKHWFSLGNSQRSDVHNAYQAYLANAIDVTELRRLQQIVLGDKGDAFAGDRKESA